MGLFSKQPTFVVHDGRFHADDIFACAVLRLYTGKKGNIIRTRDPAVIAKADFVADVGGAYDPSKKIFDHHQQGGAGIRENGIPYAAFGLVWKEYGARICGSAEIAVIVENALVLSIDAGDNGVTTFEKIADKPFPYLIQSAFSSFMPTWKEDNAITDAHFVQLVGVAQMILQREIVQACDYIEGERELKKIYETAEDKRVLVFDRMYPWERVLIQCPEPLLVVAARDGKKWKVETTLVELGSFERRMKLPAAWAGLRDEELQKVTGVSDATFCHNGRFIATAKTKEGALALAKLALDSL
jgi:uncharacterized UPF0160 family protein